ncbi:type III-B CRISPR module RAMP protein Cmr4 [Nitrosomonas sp.]|uniref:type III-B CRISPR module RAMP protein Cmr4 n=1 Tax=Nitrosomonas sp. TaxID=42353 RepID=UPI0025CDAEF3|nr:type III-B CRISPR module RAMP protein Cmr4 [Nitrosomonas sp.]
MKRSNAVIGLLAQTSIHAGSGQNTGVIDLAIQREGHNGWPCIFGSAVKGAVRTRAEDQGVDSIQSVFGAESDGNDMQAGAVAFSDARILLFPVRSLTSQFKWVACPAALKRYKNDALRMGLEISLDIPAVETWTNELAIAHESEGSAGSVSLFLEEYCFKTEQKDLNQTIAALSVLMPPEDAENLARQLVIVSDDMFSYLVQHATPVNAHIGIETETKTVKSGALWYEETLPPETLLYFTLSADKARQRESTLQAECMRANVIALFTGEQGPWLQLGGNETVGMGWCAVKINPINTGVDHANNAAE